jgi:acetolactate synthase-1/2/3 large subunit
MVAITGQVARPFIGKDAFQEIDITGITLPITKHNYLVRSASALAKTIREAFYIAKTGRPGPVLIDVPKDVFQEETEFTYPSRISLPGYKPTTGGHPTQIKKAAKLINEAKQPLILAGRGVLISGASGKLKELAENAQIPVVVTLLGISGFPDSHILNFGMVGMHGLAAANMAVNEADLIIAAGMRFDDRVTSKVRTFAPNAKFIHIDIDPAEIGKNVPADVPIVGDLKQILGELNKLVEKNRRIDWFEQLDSWRSEHPCFTLRECDDVLPQYVINQISEATDGNAFVVSGVGQHQMWAAQHYSYNKPNSFVTSGGLGTMGFGLPAAIGAKIGCPEETVWCIDGDGSFQMTLQELATISQERTAVKIAIMNNGFLGMVRQWQEFFYEKRYVATPLLGPNFVKLAEAYGIPAVRVTKKEEVIPAINKAMEEDGPFLIDFNISPEENVYPMIPSGEDVNAMLEEPRVSQKVSSSKK